MIIGEAVLIWGFSKFFSCRIVCHACRVKHYTPRIWALNMVEVECPLCSETIDLGNAEDGAYECPYCGDEFLWENEEDEIDFEEDFEEIVSKRYETINELKVSRLLENRRSRDELKFPLKVGNLKARWKFPGVMETIAIGITIAIIWPIVLIVAPIQFIISQNKQSKRKKEFEDGYLDPEYLRGSGLVIFPDFRAKLIAKSKIPAYEFEEGDLTKIVLHEEIYPGAFLKSNSTFELFLHLHDFHAMTLYGFNEKDAKDMVNKLISVYGIDLEYTSHYNNNPGGDGGSGGGG